MNDRNYNASNLTHEQLINRLKALAAYYDEYYDLEKLNLVTADTAAVLYEAAKRLNIFVTGA